MATKRDVVLELHKLSRKYACGVPVKNKNRVEVTTAMKSIFDESNRIPKNIQSEDGKEFLNKTFQSLKTDPVLDIKYICTFLLYMPTYLASTKILALSLSFCR